MAYGDLSTDTQHRTIRIGHNTLTVPFLPTTNSSNVQSSCTVMSCVAPYASSVPHTAQDRIKRSTIHQLSTAHCYSTVRQRRTAQSVAPYARSAYHHTLAQYRTWRSSLRHGSTIRYASTRHRPESVPGWLGAYAHDSTGMARSMRTRQYKDRSQDTHVTVAAYPQSVPR
eukprot:2685910-Rhodomonas_salina.2